MRYYLTFFLTLSLIIGCSQQNNTRSKGSGSYKQPTTVITSPAPDNGARIALLIGNDKYENVASLRNPVNDAKDMAEIIKNLGYEVILKTDAGRKAMIEAIQDFGAKLKKQGGVGLFYFSGHGLQVEGVNYLVPSDANIKSEADIEHAAIAVDRVMSQMEQAKNQLNLVFLDACRDNPYNTRSKGLKKGLAGMKGPTGTSIAFATAPDAPSWSGKPGERNSIYTKYLLAGLRNNSHWHLADILIAVRNQVMEETKNESVQQVPWESSSLTGQFCFGTCGTEDEELREQRAELERQRAELEKQRAQTSSPFDFLTPLQPIGEQIDFAAIFAPERDMFETTPEFKARRQGLLDKFNQAVKKRDRRYQVGVAYLKNYDADSKILRVSLKWQAAWVKQYFRVQQVKGGRIKIAPDDAKALWEAGKNKPLFITVALAGESQKISGRVLVEAGKAWTVSIPPIPEMVTIPAGRFRMGGTDDDEKPVHWVSLKSFSMSRYEITFNEYDSFAEATGRKKPYDRGWGRGNRPVINVSWHDATAYAQWLSQVTGEQYRLPTEAEWEYAARGGTDTKYWWGNDVGSNNANCYKDYCGDSFEYTAPVGSFAPNPFGLYDTAGNVWEWTCSEYEDKYSGKEQRCLSKKIASNNSIVLRGGDWLDLPRYVRSAFRNGGTPTDRKAFVGLRLVRL
ncbi:MAG: SUMF1/EgtB/PvdO family nonheme iron enzyme [Pseudomonadota bacterium]